MPIAIKIPKAFKKGSLTVVKYKDGRILLKSNGMLYEVVAFPLEIPKYVINAEGKTIEKVDTRGIIKRPIK
ncbi:hypothetical protein NEMIN01_0261 [Nematocida minor]|uniref:uncharacterized protein n=1 Tax=Nematocida minor TaxID=1912983 RepID=UPI00221ED32D|nr:uncharacterized protein NEMIN01_0261 [Nematocida minor]KAI5189095.1 hypothetical protein NEMIN01_0261 [Nematocida minor]